jgi:hypothetical protein
VLHTASIPRMTTLMTVLISDINTGDGTDLGHYYR